MKARKQKRSCLEEPSVIILRVIWLKMDSLREPSLKDEGAGRSVLPVLPDGGGFDTGFAVDGAVEIVSSINFFEYPGSRKGCKAGRKVGGDEGPSRPPSFCVSGVLTITLEG